MALPLPKIVYIMGPPGAGKGTQTMLLSPEVSYTQFSTGDAFRKILKEDTDLGRRVKDIVENGYLAPPELAAEVVIAAIQEHISHNDGLIFDGTPRTLAEAHLIDAYFEKQGYGRPLVIYLDTDKETMVDRNSKRQFCLDVNPDFPIIFKGDEKKCLALGGRIGRRVDDDPSKFDTRWNQFMELTWPVVEEYQRQGILQRVNGKLPIADVHREIVQLLNRVYHTSYKHDISEE